MRTLLIPTDFSTVADNALTYALDMAIEYKLNIALFHVTQLSTLTDADAIYADAFVKMNNDAEAKMSAMIDELKGNYPSLEFIHKTETGLFLESLKDYCEEIHPIAIVMGITGSGTLVDKIIGSNVLTTMHQINYPLLVIPRNTTFKPLQHICYACNLKKVATTTPLLPFKAFMHLFEAELHVLNIDFHNRHYTPNTQDEIDTMHHLFESMKHSFHFIEHENVQVAIDEYIEHENMDMLIMVPRKYSFFESLFHKSNTKEMLYHSHIPILALHG